MNTADVLKWGHLTVQGTIGGLPGPAWDTEGVCGWWSCKHIMAHLTSFEHVLNEILMSFLGGGATPYLDEYCASPSAFNDHQVDLRKGKPYQDVLDEYNRAHNQVMNLITQIPAETLRQSGTLPWYGNEYDLDDFIVYTFYGHKREHMAQVNVFLDRVGRQ